MVLSIFQPLDFDGLVLKLFISCYNHLHSTVKRECFFAKVYFSNVNGLVSYLSHLWRHTIMVCSHAVHVLKFFPPTLIN